MMDIKQGQTVEGKVVKIDSDGIYLDVGYKVEGFIPREEVALKPDDILQKVKVGDTLKARVIRVTPESLRLSRKSLELSELRAKINEAYKSGKIITAVVVDSNKGGLIVDLGAYRGFIPKSKVYVERGEELKLEDMIGMELELKILEIRKADNQVILSHRDAVLERLRERREQFWRDVYEGKIVEGVVRNIIDSGAFLRLYDAVDGFIPISELSWDRVSSVTDVLRLGQTVKAVVIAYDRNKNRVTLSLKALEPDPWQDVPQTYSVGQVVKGKIVRLGKYYAMVRLSYGVEGALNIEELEPENRQVGIEVEAMITAIKPESRRIALSISQLRAKREEEEVRQYMEKLKPPKFTIGDTLSL